MSRFVPAGTKPEDAPAPVPTPEDDAWAAARRDVNTKQDLSRKPPPTQEDGKSLYDTLQANKAAKQAEFEESIRLKNQFQALNEDDVDFLDSVLEIERAKENAVRKEDAKQLETYRKQQAASQKVDADLPVQQPSVDVWTTTKRRKKGVENPVSKMRKLSSGSPPRFDSTAVTSKSNATAPTVKSPASPQQSSPPRSDNPAPPASGLGLEAYSSDED